jgi:hypothetical protein
MFSEGNAAYPVTPDQITQQNSLKRAGGPYWQKKGTLRPDVQANTRPRMFFLEPVSLVRQLT